MSRLDGWERVEGGEGNEERRGDFFEVLADDAVRFDPVGEDMWVKEERGREMGYQ